MKRFSMADEFVNADLERQILAAVRDGGAEILKEVADQLPLEAFAQYGEIWRETVSAFYANEPAPAIPADWQPAEDPVAAATELTPGFSLQRNVPAAGPPR
jgi:hypothetical protein